MFFHRIERNLCSRVFKWAQVTHTNKHFKKHNQAFAIGLLDDKLRPHLLEINISPSLSSSSPLDKKIKTTLICDTLNLIGITPYDRKNYENDKDYDDKKKGLGLDKNTTKYKIEQ